MLVPNALESHDYGLLDCGRISTSACCQCFDNQPSTCTLAAGVHLHCRHPDCHELLGATTTESGRLDSLAYALEALWVESSDFEAWDG